MEPLKLVENTSAKPRDWRDALVIEWKSFRESVNRPCDMTWGTLKNRIWHMAKQTDEMTGELYVEPISEQVWSRQIEGFRKNEYARQRDYPFSLFQKQFGQYVLPPEPKAKFCNFCGGVHLPTEPHKQIKPADPNVVKELIHMIAPLRSLEEKPFKCLDCKQIHSPNFICKGESKMRGRTMIDPVCTMHGRKLSEHLCLYCCLCFRDLTIEECYVDREGIKWDMCKDCAEMEKRIQIQRGEK